MLNLTLNSLIKEQPIQKYRKLVRLVEGKQFIPVAPMVRIYLFTLVDCTITNWRVHSHNEQDLVPSHNKMETLTPCLRKSFVWPMTVVSFTFCMSILFQCLFFISVSKRVFSEKIAIEMQYLMKAKKKSDDNGNDLLNKLNKQQVHSGRDYL